MIIFYRLESNKHELISHSPEIDPTKRIKPRGLCVCVDDLHSTQPIWPMLMESTHAEQQVLMKNLWLVISTIDQPEPQLKAGLIDQSPLVASD